MITHLHGILSESLLDSIVIDVQGVGYEILVPTSTSAQLPRIGAEVLLKTHQTFREDDCSLYGFYSNEERQFFRLLLNVSGVGAKTALSALSCFSPYDLASGIANSDVKLVSKIPGVGKKSAERIIIELRDKVDKLSFIAGSLAVSVNSAPQAEISIAVQDALLALESLGFKRERIHDIVLSINESLDEKERNAQTLITRALKELNK